MSECVNGSISAHLYLHHTTSEENCCWVTETAQQLETSLVDHLKGGPPPKFLFEFIHSKTNEFRQVEYVVSKSETKFSFESTLSFFDSIRDSRQGVFAGVRSYFRQAILDGPDGVQTCSIYQTGDGLKQKVIGTELVDKATNVESTFELTPCDDAHQQDTEVCDYVEVGKKAAFSNNIKIPSHQAQLNHLKTSLNCKIELEEALESHKDKKLDELLANGINLNHCLKKNMSPLQLAVACNNKVAVEKLIAVGADPLKIINDKHESPLEMACTKGKADILHTLLIKVVEAGVDEALQSELSRLMKQVLIEKITPEQKMDCLTRFTDCITNKLIPADVAKDALQYAAKVGWQLILGHLLERLPSEVSIGIELEPPISQSMSTLLKHADGERLTAACQKLSRDFVFPNKTNDDGDSVAFILVRKAVDPSILQYPNIHSCIMSELQSSRKNNHEETLVSLAEHCKCQKVKSYILKLNSPTERRELNESMQPHTEPGANEYELAETQVAPEEAHSLPLAQTSEA
ncbi:hypothetical protein SOPP22_04565 [Shewanella sp. OPT22]|nr:hypothetical protein SOPP22_04565 [Shewanella sp. OPT22]